MVTKSGIHSLYIVSNVFEIHHLGKNVCAECFDSHTSHTSRAGNDNEAKLSLFRLVCRKRYPVSLQLEALPISWALSKVSGHLSWYAAKTQVNYEQMQEDSTRRMPVFKQPATSASMMTNVVETVQRFTR